MAALGLMATGATLFALMSFFARLGTSSASWATVAMVRALVGALVAALIARLRGQSLAAKDRRALFWRSVLGTLSMISTFYALSSRTVALADTSTLLNLSPVFLALLAPLFLRERTTPAVGGAIAIALTGVVLVVRPTILFGAHDGALASAEGPSAAVTVAVAAFGALATAVAMMFLRRVGQTESPEAIAFHFSLFAAIATGLLSLFDLRIPAPRDAGLMIAAGISGGLGQLAMTRAYARENAARVSGVSYLAVVVSALLGGAVLGERPQSTAIVGMGLVIAGGLLVTFARSPSPDPKA